MGLRSVAVKPLRARASRDHAVAFGFTLPSRGPLARPEIVGRLARTADALRYDVVLVSDHVVLPTKTSAPYPYAPSGGFPGGAHQDYLEPLVSMGWLLGVTRRVKIGVSVLVVPYRNPVVTAKQLATLDVLSGGRIVAGVGVGWWPEEFEALHAPPFAERGAVTDEYIRLMRTLWTEELPRFEGKHYRIHDVTMFPKPLQKPGPPIWVGGQTDRAIRRAAELGDAWHPIGLRGAAGLTPPELAEKLARLRDATVRPGRPAEAEAAHRAPSAAKHPGEPARRALDRPLRGGLAPPLLGHGAGARGAPRRRTRVGRGPRPPRGEVPPVPRHAHRRRGPDDQDRARARPRLERDPVSPALSPAVETALAAAARGRSLDRAAGVALIDARPADWPAVRTAAAAARDRGKGRIVTYSRKVFLPLTNLCRDDCGYCVFKRDPGQAGARTMELDEVLEVCGAGARLGCKEALLSLGDKPEARFPEHRAWLRHRGYRSTMDYVLAVSRAIVEETPLLPHANPGLMSERDLRALRETNVSVGLMLETTSERLAVTGGPHDRAPDKLPRRRLATLEAAGRVGIAFTTGLLIGIGETRAERVDTLVAIRAVHERHGHIQEV